MDCMRWSEETNEHNNPNNSSSGSVNGGANNNNNNSNNNAPPLQQQQQHSQAAPTIKNHSVTYFNGFLYCFGGYDGRRNHMTLLLYSIAEKRWIRPSVQQQQQQQQGGGGGGGAADNNHHLHHHLHHHAGGPPPPGGAAAAAAAAAGAFYGDPNIFVQGSPPPGRNGHSATLATDPDDDDNARIIIIGGWLGTGPLAASDMHILDVSFTSNNNNNNNNNNRQNNQDSSASVSSQQSVPQQRQQLLRWYQPAVKGTPPGPCNMHSADYVPNKRCVYVFRGGNGREYLNDLHALHVDTLIWHAVATSGEIPQQRANHSSAVLEATNELFIFGGWNGAERLNDIHILQMDTHVWTRPRVGGVLPHPRAGMTLTALRGRLFLFGGSGTSAKCFQDLQILDRNEMAWLDVSHYDNYEQHHNHNNNNLQYGGGGGGRQQQQQHHHNQHRADFNNDDDMMMMFRFGGGGGGQSSGQGGTGYDGRSYNGSDHHHQQHNDGPVQVGYGDEPDHHHHQHPTTHPRSAQSFKSVQADWRSRDMAVLRPRGHQHPLGIGGGGGGGGGLFHNHHSSYNNHHLYNHASPNPNDEDTVPTVLVHGMGPGRRAGHTATAVNRKIYIFGGSCGSDYLNDFFVLDTDPPPHAVVSEPTSLQLLERRLCHFFNDEEFSDVTFLVQGRKVYGHKMVLSIVSDCFRAMFTTGFRESQAMEIEIPDCSHAAFLAVMEYIYTGTLCIPASTTTMTSTAGGGGASSLAGAVPYMGIPLLDQENNMARVVEMLELADRFFLDHLKQICETLLQPTVNADTVEYLLAVAQKTNASQLQDICEHFSRNRDGLVI